MYVILIFYANFNSVQCIIMFDSNIFKIYANQLSTKHCFLINYQSQVSKYIYYCKYFKKKTKIIENDFCKTCAKNIKKEYRSGE